MKLIPKEKAKTLVAKENDSLREENKKLRDEFHILSSNLKNIKLDYSPEKLKAKEEFDIFIKDISEKKSKLLKEVLELEQLIRDKKEITHGP